MSSKRVGQRRICNLAGCEKPVPRRWVRGKYCSFLHRQIAGHYPERRKTNEPPRPQGIVLPRTTVEDAVYVDGRAMHRHELALLLIAGKL